MHRATRRISILLIAMFAFSGLALAGTAGASTPATAAKPASSCAALIKKYTKLSKINPGSVQNPKDYKKLFGQASDAYKALAKSAPSSVKGSFNRISKAYGSLKNIDYTNPASIQKLTTTTKTMAKDLGTVGKYFATNCKS
jgi:hypothetical protein